MDGRHRLQALLNSQKAVDVTWVEVSLLMGCVTQQDGCSIEETEALKLSSLANKVTSILRRDSSFLAIMKSLVNFSVALEKELGLSFFRCLGGE